MKKLYALLLTVLLGAVAHAQCTTPTLGNVTGPEPICSGSTATLTATTDGQSIHWYTQATGGTQVGTGSPFTTPALSGTTSYWAEARNNSADAGTPASGGGKLSPSSTGGTTVVPASKPWGLAFTATSNFVLNSVDVFLTSATPGNIVLFLQDNTYTTIQTIIVAAPAGGTNANPVQFTVPLNLTITAGNSYKLVVESGPAMIRDIGSSSNNFPYPIGTVGSITGGTINNNGSNPGVYYFLYNWNYTPGGPPCNSARQQVTVTVNPTPAAPTASAQAFCGSGTVANLTATGNGLKWYSVSTGGSELEATTALETGTYYVSQSNATCESTRTPVNVSVNSIPDAPVASAQSFCGSATVAALQANGTALKWYADPTGGAPLAGTAPVSAGTYYVSQTVATCESTRTSVTVTLNPLPDAPVASAQEFCGSATVSALQGSGTDLKWYDNATGGTALAGTATLSGGTYYVTQTVGTCESERTPVTVTVNEVPDSPLADDQAYCGSATIGELQANGTALKWYADATGGTSLAGTASVTTGTYYVSQTVGTCESTRTSVIITINEIPDAPDASAQLFCGDANAGDLSPNGGDLLWYASETGSPLTPFTPLETGTYYVQNTVNGCVSDFTPVEITVNPTPDAPDGLDQQTVNEGNTIADLEVTGENLTWYTSVSMNVELPQTTVLQDGVSYYVMQTVNGCPGPLLGITVSVILGVNDNNMAGLTSYPNPVENTFTITNSAIINNVEVYSLLGQKIVTKSANSETVVIDLSHLAEGTYIVKVQSGNAIKTIRIAKR